MEEWWRGIDGGWGEKGDRRYRYRVRVVERNIWWNGGGG